MRLTRFLYDFGRINAYKTHTKITGQALKGNFSNLKTKNAVQTKTVLGQE